MANILIDVWQMFHLSIDVARFFFFGLIKQKCVVSGPNPGRLGVRSPCLWSMGETDSRQETLTSADR